MRWNNVSDPQVQASRYAVLAAFAVDEGDEKEEEAADEYRTLAVIFGDLEPEEGDQ